MKARWAGLQSSLRDECAASTSRVGPGRARALDLTARRDAGGSLVVDVMGLAELLIGKTHVDQNDSARPPSLGRWVQLSKSLSF